MKVFIWQRVYKCSNNYHSEGGVVVIAEDVDTAIGIANMEEGCEIEHGTEPDYEVETTSTERKVFIFPDAGCC